MRSFGIFVLACRRVALHPLRFGLCGLALLLVSAVAGCVLLFGNALAHTADRVLDAGPSLVVSRVDAGGWAPIAVADADKLRVIPGIARVVPRVWGVLSGPPSVTVIGDPELAAGSNKILLGEGVPQAFLGVPFRLLALDGSVVTLEVAGKLPRSLDLVGYDVLLAPEDVVRRLLLLPEGRATDLAIDSVRPEEDDVLVQEVVTSLDYPVRVGTRSTMRSAYQAQLGQRGGLAALLLLPSLLAVALVVGLVAAGGPEARAEVGKLKLLGFTTFDVVRLFLAETAVVAFVAVGLGLVFAWAAVFVAGGAPVVSLLAGWGPAAPLLRLDGTGATLVLAELSALLLGPVLLAAAVPAIRLGQTDPASLLEGEA